MTPRLLTLVIASLLAHNAPRADAPERLPVKTFTGEALLLPPADATVATLIVSFSRDSGAQAENWRRGLLAANWPDPIYNVLVLEGAPRLLRGIILRSVKGDVPEDQHAQFATTFRQGDEWRALTAARNDADAHVVVLRNGDLCHRLNGDFSVEQENQLRSHCGIDDR